MPHEVNPDCGILKTLRSYGISNAETLDSSDKELANNAKFLRRLPNAIYDAAISCSACSREIISCTVALRFDVEVDWETQVYNGAGALEAEEVKVFMGSRSKFTNPA
jgi:hypothetical protein